MMLPGSTKYYDLVEEKKMKVPNSWHAKVTAALDESPLKVAASLDMSAEVAGSGICPECKSQMEEAYIGDDPVLVCMADRITLPPKDEEVAQPEAKESPAEA